MNAQEAMKYIDKEIRRLSKGIEYKVPSERAMLEDYIEAFSIVLESARFLHEAKIEDYWRDGRISTKKFIVDTHPENWKNIGIEEGA